LWLVTECTVPYFYLNSHHLVYTKQWHYKIFSTYLLTTAVALLNDHSNTNQMSLLLYLHKLLYGYLALATADCVVNYPTVANACMKLNWTRSSSATVERLQCICTSVNCQTMLYAGQNKTLDMHIFLRSILNHWSMTLTFMIIWELVRPLVAVDSRNVTD